jgi:hypothetical protein
MARKLGIVVAACCALALGFVLIGCSSVDKSNFTGDWVLVSSTDSDLDADSLALMKSLGNEGKLTLDEEGAGKLVMLGEESDMIWEASSETEGKVTHNGKESAIKVDNGELTIDDIDGFTLTFARN